MFVGSEFELPDSFEDDYLKTNYLDDELSFEIEPHYNFKTYKQPFDGVEVEETSGVPAKDYVDFKNTKIGDTF